MDIYLICDEYGAKSYNGQAETYPGEAGVFAGYLVNEKQVLKVMGELAGIAARYFTEAMKYHISDLKMEEKEAHRHDVFQILRQNKLRCLYEAIHVEGFKAEHDRLREIKYQGNRETRSEIRLLSFGNRTPVIGYHISGLGKVKGSNMIIWSCEQTHV